MNTSDSMVFVLSYHIQGKQHLHQLQQEGVLCVWWKKRQKYRKCTNSYLISEVIVMAGYCIEFCSYYCVTVLACMFYDVALQTWNLNLSHFFLNPACQHWTQTGVLGLNQLAISGLHCGHGTHIKVTTCYIVYTFWAAVWIRDSNLSPWLKTNRQIWTISMLDYSCRPKSLSTESGFKKKQDFNGPHNQTFLVLCEMLFSCFVNLGQFFDYCLCS